MLEAAVASAVEQGIIPRSVALEDLFPTNTHALVA